MAHAEVSNFPVEFEILVKRIRVEDTEAYQKMMRMKYEPFCEIFTAILVIWPFAISVWARFWQSWWPKNYHSLYSARSKNQKLLSTITSNLKMSKIRDSWWWLMIVDDNAYKSLCSNARDSWNYHQLSWSSELGLRLESVNCT